jgi:selenide,water dikinase
VKRLILAGGGHAHVEVLRRLAAARPADAELVVVTPERESPYSGMLPGHVAGFYAREAMFIDVAQLAAACGARLHAARVASIDADARHVTLHDGARLAYDLLSLDIGSTPAVGGAAGVREHALPVKPIPAFLDGWQALTARVARGDVRSMAVVGAGAAGVEMLLAMRHRVLAAEGRDRVTWHLFSDLPAILAGYPSAVQRAFERVLNDAGVAVHRAAPVARVSSHGVESADGRGIAVDATVWATGASAPAFLSQSRLALDAAGFVAVNASLQSLSHADVFAAGDVASMVDAPRPKSGVYAVRQGPPLARNLLAALKGEPLARYEPQRNALALITTGARHAVATRGGFTVQGRWVWRWKDWIDRRFIARYRG